MGSPPGAGAGARVVRRSLRGPAWRGAAGRLRAAVLAQAAVALAAGVWVVGDASAAPPAPACVSGTCTVTFPETGSSATWTVPVGVSSATVTLYGADGADESGAAGGTGGSGAEVQGTLSSLAAGQTYTVTVGGAGATNAGGFNGGGAGGGGAGNANSGGGGGATDLSGPATLFVAAGGGGGGAAGITSEMSIGAPPPPTPGGPGGNADQDGTAGNPDPSGLPGGGGGSSGEHHGAGGAGGTASGGSCPPASAGVQGNSSSGSSGGGGQSSAGGGGGGGSVGGGQGGEGASDSCGYLAGYGGGGGGSSYPGASSGNTPSGLGGNGEAIVSYAEPSQSITFTSTPPSPAVYGGSYTPAATGGGSGNPVLFSIDSASGAGVCSINSAGTVVSFTGVGTCVIDANQAGNSDYNAAGQQQQSFTVGKASQSISFTSTPPSPAVYGGSYTPAATGGGSGNPVLFSIDSASGAGVCSINSAGTVVSFTGVGTCVIDANQASNSDYSAAPVQQQFVSVLAASQSITFTSTPPSPAVYGGSYTPAATGGGSGNPVLFSIDSASGAGVCSINSAGTVVSFTGVGTCVIDANQASNSDYSAAPVQQQFVSVLAASQSISFTSTPPSPAVYGGSYTPAATGGGSGNPVLFSIDSASGAGVCSINSAGTVVSFTGVGTCVIDANQAGNSDYNAAGQQQQSFTVGKASQSISFTSTPPSPAVYGGSYTPAATGGGSGNPVLFSIDSASGAGVCSINSAGTVVSFTGLGTCVIDANQAGNGDYNAAGQQQQSFTVGKASQSISFTSTPPSPAVYGGSYTPAATGGGSGNPVLFSIDSASGAGVCSINSAGTVVSFTGVGTCVIDANQAGNGDYNAAGQQQQSFTVGKASQSISFTSTPPSPAVYGGSYTPAATGGGSGNPVLFSIDSASGAGVCSINSAGTVVSFTGVGTCVIDANQAGNADYNAGTKQQSFSVVKAPTSTVLTSSANPSLYAQPVTFTATVSASKGLPTPTGSVSFSDGSTSLGSSTLSSGGVATLTVSTLALGSHTITAAYSGNSDFSGSTSTSLAQVVQETPEGLCQLTVSDVETSPKYLALPPAQRAAINQTLTQLCNQLGTITPKLTKNQLALLIAAYKAAVTGLANTGWLTSSQATTLINLAENLTIT